MEKRWGGVGWGMLPSCSCYVDATLMGGVGWGGACYRHVHVTLMLRWWGGGVGWGMLPSCSCYVDATLMGGVGWGMLPSCSCYVDATLMGGVGWGGACYRHVHVTLMLRWWEGWGGVAHVTVMFMLRWCYVDGRGGVGCCMLPLCSCYVDAMLMGGVGWGMLPSCSCYVDATLMGGVGWGGACYRHVHVTLMLRWWEGWGGACYRHVHVTLMLRWWEGGVGWGSVHSVLYRMKTQKSPDCQHLQFSTHCQFIANNSAKVAWRKMPEKTQYICSILHDHAMTIRWTFTILHQNMRFLTSENMICGTRWLCFKTDEKKTWSVQHDAEKDVATIEKLANYLGASCFFTCWHSNTADGIGEPQSPRVYIYIYINKHNWAAHLVDG